MSLTQSSSPFDRCGLAALSDLQTPAWRGLYTTLEQEQEAFLAQEPEFRSPNYLWPRDPLHTWSRVWEYPYVYHHLQKWRTKSKSEIVSTVVVDLGSGVTFFPFSVARLGYQVICTDIDPVCEGDLIKAAQHISQEPGKVNFRLCDESTLPFSDGEVDVIYCISVLEHIQEFEKTISEIDRILKPGGLLLLTIDLDLRGDSEIGVEKYQKLISALRQRFSERYPDRTVHPADLLHSAAGPFGYKPLKGIAWLRSFFKQQILKPLLRRKPAPMLPFYLAVQGFVLEKFRG